MFVKTMYRYLQIIVPETWK